MQSDAIFYLNMFSVHMATTNISTKRNIDFSIYPFLKNINSYFMKVGQYYKYLLKFSHLYSTYKRYFVCQQSMYLVQFPIPRIPTCRISFLNPPTSEKICLENIILLMLFGVLCAR